MCPGFRSQTPWPPELTASGWIRSDGPRAEYPADLPVIRKRSMSSTGEAAKTSLCHELPGANAHE